MKRRDFLGLCGLGLPLAAGSARFLRRVRAENKRPNVVFLLADDQRFDTIHALGNAEIATPNLDQLCEQGTAFTRAHIMGGSLPAVCVPSRAMLLTGRNLFSLKHNGDVIPEEHRTMPEAFRAAGYRTCGIGKWHNGRAAYARSFSEGAHIHFGGMGDHFHLATHDFDPSGAYPEEAKRLRDGHSSEFLSDAAIDFLRTPHGEQPFFLYLAYLAPHDPRLAPESYLRQYDPERIALPDNFLPEHPFDNGELRIRDELLAPFPRTPEAIRRHIADYYAMITHLDAQIGRVLAALEESGLAGNTIVVFGGDNGLAVGQHGLMGKQNLYECSVRVPLLMRGPGVPSGVRRDTFCYLSDVFPTLSALANVPVPDSVESRSMLPALQDSKRRHRDHVFYAYRDVQRGVCDGRWKLIEYSVNGQRTTQLFDLQSDPQEKSDLSGHAEQQITLARLRVLLGRSQADLRDPASQSFRTPGNAQST